MMRSLGLIFGVDISGLLFTSLKHQYLTEKGHPSVQHIFSSSLPVPVKDNAFMHGFLMVIGVLLALNLLSSFFSATNKADMDTEMAEAAREFVDMA